MKKTPAAAAAAAEAAAAAAAAAAPPPTGACDQAQAPVPQQDRSQYITSTVIVLCLVALALGYYFVTNDGSIVCFTHDVTEAIIGLKKLCTQVVLLITFDESGQAQQDLTTVNTLKASFNETLLIGMKFQENQEPDFFNAVGKSEAWNISRSHALTGVSLTKKTSQELQVAAIELQTIKIMCLLATSTVNDTVAALPLIGGLEVLVITPKCEANAWNEMEELTLLNAMKATTTLDVALSLTAAAWKKTNKGDGMDTCTQWQEITSYMVDCVQQNDVGHCKNNGMIFVDNATIGAMVKYAKSKGMNTFAIFSADRMTSTVEIHRQFDLLSFGLPRVPEKNGLLPSIPLRSGLDDSPSSGSGLRAVRSTSVTGSDAEPVGSEMDVKAAEHHGKFDGVKASSSKSAKRIKKPRRGPMASSAPSTPAIQETQSRRATHWAATTTSTTPWSQPSCESAEGCAQK